MEELTYCLPHLQLPDDGNLVVVEGLHLSPVHVHVPLHVGGNGGARAADAEDDMSLISSHFRFVFELSPVDPFVVVDFVPAEEPVFPSSSAVLGRKRVERRGSSGANDGASATRGR